MSNKVRRFQWEDAVIEAGATGGLSETAVNVALRLARVIHWEPSGGGASELRWKNELAAEAVGLGRSRFFDGNKELKAKGFLTEQNKNLFPAIPSTANSTNKAYEARIESLKVKHGLAGEPKDASSIEEKPEPEVEKKDNTKPDYAAMAKAAGVEPDGETLRKLEAKSWHRRQDLIFLPGELEEAALELKALAQIVGAYDLGRVYPVRAAGPLCRSCEFREICPEPESEVTDMLFKRVPPKRERVNDKRGGVS